MPMTTALATNLRKSGIAIWGDIPWGTHVCQFYKTKDDLAGILLPYFKAGLENNEFCVWITSDSLQCEEAMRLLKEYLPDGEAYLAKGQLEIIPYTEWYLQGGAFEMKRVLSGWIEKHDYALAHGYAGMRVTGNTSWIAEKQWELFAAYEEEINKVLDQYRILVLCTYAYDLLSASQMLDVVSSHESTLLHQDGKWRAIESSGQKKARKALRESEKRYHSLFNHMTEGSALHEIICDEKGEACDYRFLEINPAFERLTGLKREEVIGKTVLQILPALEPHWIKTYASVALTGQPVHFDNYSRALGRYYEVYAYCPAPRHFATLFVDITERKKNEAALQRSHDGLERMVERRTKELSRSNELLEKLFTNTNYLLAYLDTEFTFIRVNEKYAQADNRTPDYFTGKNHFDLYPSEENKRMFQSVLDTGVAVSIFAKPFEYGDHPERGVSYWDWSLQPVKNAGGEIEGLVFTLVDVTKRVLYERQLAETQQQLQHAKRLSDIGRLASTIAHEIRNPLSGIGIAAYNIEKKAGGPLIAKHLETINKKIADSDQIIQNLLAFSRIKMSVFEKLDLCKTLKECVGAVSAKYVHWDVALKVKYLCGAGSMIEADLAQVKMLLSNILDNAYQSLRDKAGSIRVSVSLHNRHYRIAITDTGAGMDAGEQEKIFEPFFTTKSRGTGLGLTVCREIVDMHRGKIEVESRKGEGAAFTITLPMLQSGKRGKDRVRP